MKLINNELPKQYDPKNTEERIYELWEKSGAFKPANRKSQIANRDKPSAISDKRYAIRDKPFTIVIPPPNVTGSLHMGHALNNTIQDILIRRSRMRGIPTLWVPGTDHAGIATQNVVEKKLQKEGKSRKELGRENFEKEIHQWVKKYGHIIIDQLKKLGCSCDWTRQRFTMDPDYAEAVKKAFLRYYEKGWIYQGERVINWCIHCQTALSDIEVEHKEVEGKLWYIRYPIQDSHPEADAEGSPANAGMANKLPDSSPAAQNDNFIVVATTRPETMLGDTAVAVNPNDKRYKNLVGKTVVLPLTNREIPIIADDSVDREFGTGAVKVTPAHDMNDFEIGERHKLERIKVIGETGKITQIQPQRFNFTGQKVMEARENIVAELQTQGLLEKEENYLHQVPHCYRCGRQIEQLLSKQWFLKMKELAKPAISAVESGEIKFVPERWSKVYLDWMKNIHDWCISRQIWWGHRLPVFTKPKAISNSQFLISNEAPNPNDQKIIENCDIKNSLPLGTQIENCKIAFRHSNSSDIYVGDNPPEGYKQVDDVLDTWFSSALWPFATLGWPQKAYSISQIANRNNENKKESTISDKRLAPLGKLSDLDYFYPTTTLSTARDILYLWVARMIFSGFEFMNEKPFSTVYIHPTIFNIEGKRMSKSLGTGIDPLELIDKYGADATRFGLTYINTGIQDIKFDENAILAGQKFANKIWNISRFVLIQIESHPERSNVTLSKVKSPSRMRDISETSSEILRLTPQDDNPQPKTDDDKKVLNSLDSLIISVNSDLDNFRFGQAAHDLYDFIWHDFADVYIEKCKMQNASVSAGPSPDGNGKINENTQDILLYALTTSLKLLHPMMPFLTEEIWQNLEEKDLVDEKMLISAKWPEEKS